MTTSSYANRLVDDGRTVLAAQGDPRTVGRLAATSIRLLAAGRPVSPAQIAEASGVSVQEVERTLRDIPDIEWTADGLVEGFGLTPHPTPHRFRVGDVDLYAWCAMDTLIFARLLDRPVQIESPDGETGIPLRLETDGSRIIAADPPSTVVSWYVDPTQTGIRASVCQFGHFFASREGAAAWAAKYPKGGVVNLEEALEGAGAIVSELFLMGDETSPSSAGQACS
jgi:alkylmercury lyase